MNKNKNTHLIMVMKSGRLFKTALPAVAAIFALSMTGALFEHSNFKSEPTAAISDCDPDTVYFKQDVLPLLQSNCAKSGCHNEESKKHGVILSSYENLMATVEFNDDEDDDDPDDDSSGRDRDKGRGKGNGDRYRNKLEKMIKRNKMPPAPEKKLTFEQRNIILKWIDQGMLNNSCATASDDCITEGMKFSKDIKPIIDDNCVGCHGGAKPKMGYDFSKPEKFKEVALSGDVYLAITHSEGVTAMPFEGDKLSDCDISKIKAWIDDGAKLD